MKLLLGAMTLGMMGAASAGASQPAGDGRQAELARLMQEQERLLKQLRREIALLPAEPPTDARLSPDERARLARRRELISLTAELERRLQSDKAGRTKYISSSVTEAPFKAYFQRFQRRVEEAGTQEFPRADGKAIYGAVLLSVSITPSGAVQGIDVHRSSSDALARHASSLLRKLAPFEAYGASLGKDVELLVLTVPFSYADPQARVRAKQASAPQAGP